jgi:hypothetical protein
VLVSRTFLGLRPRLWLIAIVSCGGIVIALTLIVNRAHIQLGLPATHPEVVLSGSGSGSGSVRAILDLASLVRQSDMVVVARAAGSSGGRLQPGQAPSTSYTVDVESVVRGTAPGSPQLVVNVPIEDDTQMAIGQRYVLFLKQADGGTFFIVGGLQGLLSIDTAGNVHPANPGVPATHAYDGQPLNAFIAAVTAVP